MGELCKTGTTCETRDVHHRCDCSIKGCEDGDPFPAHPQLHLRRRSPEPLCVGPSEGWGRQLPGPYVVSALCVHVSESPGQPRTEVTGSPTLWVRQRTASQG